MPRYTNTEEFLKRAEVVHGNRYEYSLVNYQNSHSKIQIICKNHGLFEQLAYKHLDKHGCPKCGRLSLAKKMATTQESFIKNAQTKHSNKYDYFNVMYVNTHTKVIIGCNIHGDFQQTPKEHLKGQGCRRCGITNNSLSLEEFKTKANEIHNKKFDYSLVDYKNNRQKVNIICPIHGEFLQRPETHLRGFGCFNCTSDFLRKSKEKFIKQANRIHNFYTYEKVIYISGKAKVIITCPIHGDFEQKPTNHLHGQGCFICRESHGEKQIRNILLKYQIPFDLQFRINECRNIKPLPFDFRIYSSVNFGLIEYHGMQHYSPVKLFGGIESFDRLVQRDTIKDKYCKDNKIPLLIISYNCKESIEKLVYNFATSLGVINEFTSQPIIN